MENAERSVESQKEFNSFIEFVGDLVISLKPYCAGNRIVDLSTSAYVALEKAVAACARMAAKHGCTRLNERAQTLAARLCRQTAQFATELDSFLLIQALDEFVDEAQASLHARVAVTQTAEKGHQKTVLIVDDERIELDMVTKALGPVCDVIAAQTASEALDLLKMRQPDMIILDVDLGLESGTDLLKAIKDNPDHSRIPTVMRSGNVDDQIVITGLVNGALDYISKEVPLDELRHRTMDLLQNGRERLFNRRAVAG